MSSAEITHMNRNKAVFKTICGKISIYLAYPVDLKDDMAMHAETKSFNRASLPI